MRGAGINDAPALAAAAVGVAVAGSPRDLVAAAADAVLLNGQGAAALPWLLRAAAATQVRGGQRGVRAHVPGQRDGCWRGCCSCAAHLVW
jgi:hypothetical protein